MRTPSSDAYAWITEPAPGTGRTVWVATTGNDTTGDGSFENPYRTIFQATRSGVGRGDEIVVRPGTYNEAPYIWRGNLIDTGNEGQLTIRSEIEGQALIRPPDWAYSAVQIRADNITLEGFDIEGALGLGIDVDASAYTVLRGNSVHDSGGTGIRFLQSEFILIEDNMVFDNTRAGNNEGGIAIYQNRNITGDTDYPGFRTIIRDNYVYDNIIGPSWFSSSTDGAGILIEDFQSTQSSGYPNYNYPSMVLNNLVVGNSGKGIMVVTSDSVYVVGNTSAFNNVDDINDGLWPGELVNLQSNNTTWMDNIAVTDTSLAARSTAIGNYSYDDGTNENVVWYDNLTYSGVPGDEATEVTQGNLPPSASDGNLLGVDPQFVNVLAGDFQVAQGSPAEGVGWNADWAPPDGGDPSPLVPVEPDDPFPAPDPDEPRPVPGEPASPPPGAGEPASPAPGETPSPGEATPPTPGEPSSPSPGEPTSPAPGEPTSPTPGQPASPTPGEPVSPGPGEPVSPAPGEPAPPALGGPVSPETEPPFDMPVPFLPETDALPEEEVEPEPDSDDSDDLGWTYLTGFAFTTVLLALLLI